MMRARGARVRLPASRPESEIRLTSIMDWCVHSRRIKTSDEVFILFSFTLLCAAGVGY